MSLRIVFSFLAIIVSGVLILSSSAFARLTCDPVCLNEAKGALQNCVSDCREVFQQAKDSCRNIDHDCAETCRAAYDACVIDPLSDLAECKVPCNTALTNATAICRTEYDRGTHERDVCVDQAQVVAFTCKDACREQYRPPLTACRDAFKSCIIGCKIQ